MGRLPRKYTPKSDFSVWLQELDLPLIIGEIINEQDRYRMLFMPLLWPVSLLNSVALSQVYVLLLSLFI